MLVAFYDRLPIDRPELYGAAADIAWCSRFRPHSKLERAPDLVIATYTYVPDTGTPVVSLLSSGRRTTNLHRSPVTHVAGWSTHDTAATALTAIRDQYDGRPVLVIGRGRIGRRVHRWLRRYGYTVDAMSHDGNPPLWWSSYGTVTLHTAPGGRHGYDQALPAMQDAHLVNTAQPDAVSRTCVAKALAAGNLRRYTVDGGTDPVLPGVAWSPHCAWDGHHAAWARPRTVLRVITEAQQGRYLS